MSAPMSKQFNPIEEKIRCLHNSTREYWVDKSFPYHRHDAFEILLFLRGDTYYYIEQACYHLTHGDVIIINPNELHRAVCSGEQIYERIFIHVKKSVLVGLSSDKTNLLECFESSCLEERKIIHLTEDQIEEFIMISHNLEHFLQSSEYGSDVLVDAFISQLLVMINTLYKGSTYTPINIMSELIRDTMSYIKEHLEEPIYLEQLSKQFYLSGTHISREFKKYTGLTVRSYILEERIAKSKQLLSEGKNVSEACYSSGFFDYSNFIRSFTKIVGISPGQYKKTKWH